MLTKSLSAALLGATLLAAPAFAQQTPAAGGAGSWITQETPGQWRASKLDGLDVYNGNNEKIGDIKDLLVDNSGKVQAVVIGVGGFLGMGEHDVALPFEQIKFVNEPRANAATANNAATAPAAPAAGTASTTTGVTTPANPNTSVAGTTTSNTVNSTGTVATASRDTGNRTAPDHALLDMSKDQLKAAPEFKYTR
jgi:sporulation protein YlmC with PRC-barrel domain